MKIVAGVDEVGRGSLIGPVYAAAVILNKSINRKLLKDEDNNRYPIQLKKGNLFFLNSIAKVFFEYPDNTKLLLIRLLHEK